MIDHHYHEARYEERRQKRLAKLNAHIERVARVCAIGDACCRAIEALQPAAQAKGGAR